MKTIHPPSKALLGKQAMGQPEAFVINGDIETMLPKLMGCYRPTIEEVLDQTISAHWNRHFRQCSFDERISEGMSCLGLSSYKSFMPLMDHWFLEKTGPQFSYQIMIYNTVLDKDKGMSHVTSTHSGRHGMGIVFTAAVCLDVFAYRQIAPRLDGGHANDTILALETAWTDHVLPRIEENPRAKQIDEIKCAHMMKAI